MLFRSTGLGKTELTGRIAKVERQGDYLILQVDVTDPVKWKIRGGLSARDLMTLMRLMIKLSVIGFILNPRQWFNKNPKPPGEY